MTYLPPASNNSTRMDGSSDRRDANTQPDVPACEQHSAQITCTNRWDELTSTDDDHVVFIEGIVILSNLLVCLPANLGVIRDELGFTPRRTKDKAQGSDNSQDQPSVFEQSIFGDSTIQLDLLG